MKQPLILSTKSLRWVHLNPWFDIWLQVFLVRSLVDLHTHQEGSWFGNSPVFIREALGSNLDVIHVRPEVLLSVFNFKDHDPLQQIVIHSIRYQAYITFDAV